MFYQESRSRAPSLSAHTPIFLFTYKPASVEHGSRHVLHVIVGEMEWNTGLGLRVQIAGFRVTRSRSQWRLVLPRCFLALWPWARDGDWESVARGWERKVRDRSKPWATMHPAPKGSWASGFSAAHSSHIPSIGPWAWTRSHCGLFYNLEPQLAFKPSAW